MKIQKIFIIICITALSSLHAYAEGLTGSVDQLSVSQDMPIIIEADSLEILENEKKAIFSGQVRIVQDKISLTANLVNITYSYKEEDKKTSIESIECLDNVLIQIDDQIASGNKAYYDLLTKKIKISGDVLLSKGNNAIKGEAALLDLNSRKIKIISSEVNEGSRVRAILTPNQSN
jgi:lipopolysaccharide export system protein LptA